MYPHQFVKTSRRIWFLLLLALVPYSGGVFAQEADDEFRCRVRSVVEWETSSPSGRRRPKKARMEVFDPKRRLIVYTVYKDDGDVLYSDINTYDAQGRLIHTRTTHSRFVYLPDVAISSYSRDGRLMEIKGYDTVGRHLGGHLYDYNSAGRLREWKTYAVGKNEVYTNHLTRYEYDEEGNLLRARKYSYKGSEIIADDFGVGYTQQITLKNSRGFPIETKYLRPDESLLRTTAMNYDRRGNLVEELETRPDGTIQRRVTYSYVYDRFGNWVRQVRREWKAPSVGSPFESVFGNWVRQVRRESKAPGVVSPFEVQITRRQISYYRNPCAVSNKE